MKTLLNAARAALALLVLVTISVHTAFAQDDFDGCGDLNQDGTTTLADLSLFWTYLYNGGPAPDSLHLANIDGRGGINFGDIIPMFYGIVQFQGCHLAECTACRTPEPTYPINPAETVYVRNHPVPAGADSHVAEVWVHRSPEEIAVAFPFAFSCPTGPVTLDSIVLSNKIARDQEIVLIDSTSQNGFFAFHRANASQSQPGRFRLASLYFSLPPQGVEQAIVIDTATCFGAETFLTWSFWANGRYGSMRPLLYGTPSTEAQPPSCCVGQAGDVNGSGGASLTDLTLVVNHLFVNFEPLSCPAAANINGDSNCIVNLSDLTGLVNWLFVCFGCLPADCNSFDNFICGGQ